METLGKVELKRNSSVELLRIVAMFLVLVVHADFFTLGVPDRNLIKTEPLFSFGQLLFESFSIVCVNVFVLISGWFGLRPKLKGFCNFIFQCLFFSIGIYILICLFFDNFSIKGFAECFFLTGAYWFIKAYIGLYLLSPLVNRFIETVDGKTLLRFIIFFYLYQTIFAWCSKATTFLDSGCNTISFIGLYCLARYFHLYPNKWTSKKPRVYIWGYLGLSVVCAVTSYVLGLIGLDGLIGRFYVYVSPFVILSSLLLLLGFTRMQLSSKFINWVASSCFAVYLLHVNPNVIGYFCKVVEDIVQRYSGFMVLLVLFMFLLMVFIVSILIDKVRIMLWNYFICMINHRKLRLES